MSATDFDFGGEVAETSGGFKNPDVGSRQARLYGLLRLGTFRETFGKELKAPAPQAVAIFHLLGKNDKMDDGSPMFFTKTFPLKKGSKSFMNKTFIPALGGYGKHNGFGSMINQLHGLVLKGSEQKNDDGKPKYINFDTMSELSEDILELLELQPQYAALEDAVGFQTEGELTEEALKMLHPVREFADILMKTQEFQEGRHPSQELIQKIYDEDPERYTRKVKDDESSDADSGGENNEPSGASSEPKGLPAEAEQIDEEQEF